MASSLSKSKVVSPMSIDFHWHNDERNMIRLDMYDRVTWVEWFTAIAKTCNTLDRESHDIDLIIHDRGDMPEDNAIPYVNAALSHLNLRDNLGSIIVVGSADIAFGLRAVFEIVTRARDDYPVPSVSVGTLDEAEAYLQGKYA